MALVDFQVDSFSLRLHHVFKEGYVVLNDIYFDGSEQKICCGCVDELRGRSKSDINICHKTAAAIDESDKSDVGVFLLLNFS